MEFFFSAKDAPQDAVEDHGHLAPLHKLINHLKQANGKEDDPYCLNSHALLTKEDIVTIQNITRGQSDNEIWYEIRRGMMTASNFHRIKTRCKTLQNDPTKRADALLNHLCKKHCDYAAIPESLEWGRKTEKKALALYKKLSAKSHIKPQIKTTGLCLSEDNFLIGASPDGIGRCTCNKSSCPRKWLVEIKCPHTLKYRPAKIAAMHNGCYYDHTDKKWKLSDKHKHFTQVQGLMGVLKFKNLDFVVYTTKGILVVNVEFDVDFFMKLVTELRFFQESYLFPYIVNVIAKQNN